MFRLRRIIVVAVLAVCLAFVGLVVSLYFRQHSLLYHPRPYKPGSENALPPDAVELHFATIAGKQVAFYLPGQSGNRFPKRIWVAFCGNGSLALDWMWLLRQDRGSGDAFLLVDYPGYGKSDGYASIATTRATADGVLKALAAHLGVNESEIESRLDVIGHSLGTAVALDFATRHPVGHIILVSAFTTLREEAATMVGQPLSRLLVENYDNRAALGKLARRSQPPRVDIFHGTDDDTIPIRMGRELAEGFPGLVKFHPVAGGDHVSVIDKAADEIVSAISN
jgi:uncharacterized protein